MVLSCCWLRVVHAALSALSALSTLSYLAPSTALLHRVRYLTRRPFGTRPLLLLRLTRLPLPLVAVALVLTLVAWCVLLAGVYRLVLGIGSAAGYATGRPLESVLAAGVLGQLSDSEPTAAAAANGTAVCIFSWEVAGPQPPTDLGVATTGLALLLAGESANRVSLVAVSPSVRPRSGHGDSVEWTGQSWAYWQRWFAARRVSLTALVEANESLPQYRATFDEARVSHLIYRWLLDHPSTCRIVHFHDWRGPGFHTTTAASLRLHPSELDHLLFVVTAHSPHLWATVAGEQMARRVEDLQIDHYERSSIARAHVVLAPSTYMLHWMTASGYSMPPTSQVWPLPVTSTLLHSTASHSALALGGSSSCTLYVR